MKTITRSLILLGAALAAVAIAGCDHDLLDDATFRLWCGDSLCSWRLDAGRVQKAPTWHQNDFGVELLDTPTTISQDLKGIASCLAFTTIADVDPGAQVTVGIDFTGDGILDYEQPVAAVGFRSVRSEVTAPVQHAFQLDGGLAPGAQPARLFITKKGTGRAVLAQIRLQSTSSCGTPLRLRDRPLGDRCLADGPNECASGVCCNGVCSECCTAGSADGSPEVACAGGGVCARRPARDLGLYASLPPQCDPGRGLRPADAACFADDDCASGDCTGAASAAVPAGVDGGLAASQDPCGAEYPDAGREECAFVRVAPGKCR